MRGGMGKGKVSFRSGAKRKLQFNEFHLFSMWRINWGAVDRFRISHSKATCGLNFYSAIGHDNAVCHKRGKAYIRSLSLKPLLVAMDATHYTDQVAHDVQGRQILLNTVVKMSTNTHSRFAASRSET